MIAGREAICKAPDTNVIYDYVMKGPIKILFVEDVMTDAEIIWREISRDKIIFEKRHVENQKDYIDALISYKPDLIISDFMLPQFDGMTALKLKNDLSPLVPFILVTGSVNEEIAVECMKAGADDYVLKQNLSRLVPSIRAAMAKKDILQAKEIAERELRESEEKFRSIFENVQDLYYESSIDGTILEVSPSILSLSRGQYHREELIGKSMSEFYSFPGERQLLMETLLEKGSISDFEVKLRNRDGSLIPSSVSAKLFLDAGGHPIKVIGSIRDITERKRMEQKVIESEAYYRTLIDVSPDGIIIGDLAGIVTYCSIKALEIFGVPPGEKAVGTSILKWLAPDSHHRVMERIREIILGNTAPETREYELRKFDGTIFWGELSSSPLVGADGTPAELLVVFRDITVRKAAESELIKSKEKAEEGDRLKTAFLQNISHEIRTPMNAIIGFSALLSDPGIDIKSQKSFVEYISQSSYRLLEILNDIIEVSNIEAGILKIKKSEANLNKLFEMLLEKYKPAASEKGIGLTIQPGLPDSKVNLVCDHEKIKSILTSLLGNALKFTTRGEIILGYKLTGSDLEFFVSDTGIGIPEEHHKKVFDRFYQVENTLNRQYEGTGLGLSITKAYVKLLGGKIWFSSKPGKGSVFCFTIPYNPDEKYTFME